MNTVLLELARAQHGVVSRNGAVAAGLTHNEWRSLVHSDGWVKVHQGVYRVLGAPRTYEQSVMAGCLAINGVATHRTAGILWGLPDIPQRFELAIPRRRRAELPGFDVYRVGKLPPVDRTSRRQIPCTALPRTVLDVCLLTPQHAPQLLDHVLGRRKVPLKLLIDRLNAMGVEGRKGAGDLMALLTVRTGRERHVDSGLQRKMEQITMQAYRAGLLPEPVFEYPIRVAKDRWRYADVGYPPLPVGFEVVSYIHHETIEDFCSDQERNLELFGEGMVIVPVTKEAIASPARLVQLMGRILMKHGWEGPHPAGVRSARRVS